MAVAEAILVAPAHAPTAEIVVERLTKNINEDHLYEIFGQFGPVKDLDLPISRLGVNRGTAYILYDHEADAEDAIAHMHEAQVDGAIINALTHGFHIQIQEDLEEWVAPVEEVAVLVPPPVDTALAQTRIAPDQPLAHLRRRAPSPAHVPPPLRRPQEAAVAVTGVVLALTHVQDLELRLRDVEEGAAAAAAAAARGVALIAGVGVLAEAAMIVMTTDLGTRAEVAAVEITTEKSRRIGQLRLIL
ncbi:hypothetical protein SODALDRAFT_322204 [Sodiomyces alkalinus F11]|uniref:RRM domain-containing protein n=1 Tax=Sodiomyces alkalinus (strain CBS 110278 / VKM F-3762 / F11) TaxID=1314773 RepID=A0A3N2Q2Q4_SODAK|nr:hypothetical protein SODALDRAFT_322204 [Sodiomyces alkalinus F11]ROT40958.1 hypothetical protein SODALDRAFT_322204 [Sodiomyces alkalinus F11]